MTHASRLWWLAGALLGALLTIQLLPVLAPFFVAAGLAYLGDPMVRRLQKKMRRSIAVLVVFSLLSMTGLIALLILIPLLIKQIGEFALTIPALFTWFDTAAIAALESTLGMELPRLDLALIGKQIANNLGAASSLAAPLLSGIATSGLALIATIVNLAIIPVVTFYLMLDWDKLLVRVNELIPPSLRATITPLAKDCDTILSAFIRGQLMVMLALGATYVIGLWLIGLELALLIGAIAGIASLVPYLGAAVGILAASIAALYQWGDLFHLALVGGVFLLGQILESVLFTPLLIGDRIGLHPVAVIFAVMAGGHLFGFAGILLALPVAAVLMVLLRELYRRYRESKWYTAQQQ